MKTTAVNRQAADRPWAAAGVFPRKGKVPPLPLSLPQFSSHFLPSPFFLFFPFCSPSLLPSNLPSPRSLPRTGSLNPARGSGWAPITPPAGPGTVNHNLGIYWARETCLVATILVFLCESKSCYWSEFSLYVFPGGCPPSPLPAGTPHVTDLLPEMMNRKSVSALYATKQHANIVTLPGVITNAQLYRLSFLLTIYGHIKSAEQRTIIHQCGDWHTGRWWVGTARKGFGGLRPAQSPPRCTNGQCTNFILFDVAR